MNANEWNEFESNHIRRIMFMLIMTEILSIYKIPHHTHIHILSFALMPRLSFHFIKKSQIIFGISQSMSVLLCGSRCWIHFLIKTKYHQTKKDLHKIFFKICIINFPRPHHQSSNPSYINYHSGCWKENGIERHILLSIAERKFVSWWWWKIHFKFMHFAF